MSGDRTNRETGGSSLQQTQQEQSLAAIVLLLGPDTDYYKRMRAAQRLARVGADVLPLLLQALHTHPEIATPAWPWWPPQYEPLGRLLIQLSQSARLTLADLLRPAYVSQPPGPVLWTSIIEAIGQLPHMEYEPLLREALTAPWWTVRYAAAMAIARRAMHISLGPATREALAQCQHTDPEIQVRLVAASALLRCADSSGLETLAAFLEPSVKAEIRRVALFILASERPVPVDPLQRVYLSDLLLRALRDHDQQITLYAARALRGVANASTLAELDLLLDTPRPQTLFAVLTALEELASRKTMRYAMQQQQLPRHITALLQHADLEMRQQACYTLAALGGEYAIATLGTIILDNQHPAHLEAIDALRLLPDLRRSSVLVRVLRWLQHTLVQPIQLYQDHALNTLSYIIWQAHARQRHGLLQAIYYELQQGGCFLQLLASSSAQARQRSIDLLYLLDPQFTSQRPMLLEMLQHDIDSGVRSCIARILGQSVALWAIPDLLLALLDHDEHVAESALHALTAMPQSSSPLIYSALQEIAAYRLPLWKLSERRRLAHVARVWLKGRTAWQ
ncbi:MAG TPA: HEAT repeat domain-containing protein [Ktedonobacteraceae bacterium]